MLKRIPLIKSPREYRLLHSLFHNNGLSVKELREIIGANNVPDVVMSLRNRGWVIHCERIDFYDRDGRNCRPGIYWLDDDFKHKASIAIKVCKEEWEAATSHSMPESLQNQHSGI
jgi:hypothetical protein